MLSSPIQYHLLLCPHKQTTSPQKNKLEEPHVRILHPISISLLAIESQQLIFLLLFHLDADEYLKHNLLM